MKGEGRLLVQSNLARWKAAMAVAVMVLAAACGSTSGHGGSTSPPASAATTGSPQADSTACRDAVALRASLENILSYQAGKDSIASLRADLGDANNKVATLRAAPHDTWSPQLTALETALKKLRTEAVNPDLLARPAGITRALVDVRPKAQAFITASKTQCP